MSGNPPNETLGTTGNGSAITVANATTYSFDIAINGDGFFTTKSPQTGQTYYTRNGGFAIASQARHGIEFSSGRFVRRGNPGAPRGGAGWCVESRQAGWLGWVAGSVVCVGG